METLRRWMADLEAWFSALNPRERTLVSIGGVAVVATALFITVLSFSSAASNHRRRIEEKLVKLQQAQALAESYQEADQVRQEAERQLSSNSVPLISYIEEKGAAAGLEIPSMNPKGEVAVGDGKILENAVELTLTDVPIRKVHAFLSDIEKGPGVVKVKYLRLEPRASNGTLTAWASIATYKLKP